MNATIPYLNFDGNCRPAMEFYAKALGAELTIMPFSDMPGGGGGNKEATKDRIMHARLMKKGLPYAILMASDTMPGMPYQQGTNFSVSVGCDSLNEIKSFFSAMSEGAAVTMPLQDQFWGAHFGMLKDQFGIHWMFSYEYPKA
jgi:PhnB protein